jgi:hypothetical protein
MWFNNKFCAMVACHFNLQFQVLAFFKRQKSSVWFILSWTYPFGLHGNKMYTLHVNTHFLLWGVWVLCCLTPIINIYLRRLRWNLYRCLNLDRHITFVIGAVTTLALGSRPRQRGLQGCGPRGSPRITPHAPESVGKCEGMNPHTPKATPTLGNGVSMDSQIFRGRLQRSKLNGLRSSL